MKKALNAQGQLIHADEVTHSLSNAHYYCPMCHQAMYYKINQLGSKYFAHYYACQSKKQERQCRESQAHLDFKKWMEIYFKQIQFNVEIEQYHPEIQRFADVFIAKDRFQWILEYQQSPIQSEILKTRHQQYQQQGYRDIWVGDETLIQSNSLAYWPGYLRYYDSNLGYYLLTWDSRKHQVVIRPQLPLIYQKHHCDQQKFIIKPYLLLNLRHWKALTRRTHPSILKPINEQKFKRRCYQIRHSTHNFKYLEIFYQMNLQLESLPTWLLSDEWVCTAFKEPTWFILGLTYQWIIEHPELIRHPAAWTLSLQESVEEKFLTTMNFPLTDGKDTSRFWLEIYQLFKQYGLGKQ